jgi:PhzF family phenazine biosynthesis protein
MPSQEAPAGGSGGLDAFRTGSVFGLRWFTPTAEVPLCGHATLASAHVLFSELSNPSGALRFDTLSGRLIVRRVAKGGRRLLELDLPLAAPDAPLPPSLAAAADGALSPRLAALVAACTGDLGASFAGFAKGVDYLLLLLPEGTTRRHLEGIKPDFAAMAAAAGPEEVHGVIVAVEDGGEGYDFCSRFFGPWLGIPEDPVTGESVGAWGILVESAVGVWKQQTELLAG